jgi:glycosyltransferase involved in cell wall biosynthesis
VKVLLYSPAFLPHVGGLEIHVAHLAAGLQAAGHDVVVVTQTPAAERDTESYQVVRRPGVRELLRWTRWCDVFFQANVSLRGIWPLALFRRPWVVSHHSWYRRPDGSVALRDRLKRGLLRFAAGSIAVSEAVNRDLGGECTVIANAYRDDLFRVLPGTRRDRELLFVGRLVSDKGVDVLLDALALLRREGFTPALTVAGVGPERQPLEARAERLGVADQVSFVGARTGEDLVELMNRHRVLVVPSRYREPFGLVALEGIACGCLVVGSEGGGLPEAIGGCGLTFPNGDAAALADALRRALAAEAEGRGPGAAGVAEHLARHSTAAVLDRYESLLAGLAPGTAAPGGPPRGSWSASE